MVIEQVKSLTMSKAKDEAALNQQVEDLRDRLKMLQNDRKANVDVLEANKSSNKDEIKKLRDENKDLRQKYAQLQRTTAQDSEKDEKKQIEREVDRLRKIHDEFKTKAARLGQEYDKLKDQIKDLELDSKRPHMEDNEYTRRIRSLENKLDKAMIKFNEAQSIRKTYEQIVRRLNEERVGFDNQLAAIERTLAAKQRDFEELLLLAGDSKHARETALGELERVRMGYEEERKRRDKDLRERHQVVQLRRQMLERMKQREKLRHQLAGAKTQADVAADNASTASQKSIALEKLESRNKVDIFENAFRKIKEATGVSDVNEVIQKIVSQESTTENLIAVTKENQAKIEALTDEKKRIKIQCEELKYSGVGGGQHRKMVDSYEDQLANSATRLERSRLKYERLSKIIISMKAGVGHMQDKLESFREEISGKYFTISDETVTDVLRECENCFSQLNKRIKAAEDEAKRAHITDAKIMVSAGNDSRPDTASLANDIEETAGKMNTLRPYNQRIELNGERDESLLQMLGTYDDDNSIDALDDEELTRDKVKRASSQILQAMDKKKKRPKKKNAANAAEAD